MEHLFSEAVLRGHTYGVTCVTTINNNIISDSYDGIIKIWKPESQEYTCISSLTEHTSKITCLAALSNNQFVSGSLDASLKIWKPEDEEYTCITTLRDHITNVKYVKVLQNESIVSGSDDGTLKIWAPNEKIL